MPDFIRRFGELDASGKPFLSSSRQSIITSLLSAGLVRFARRLY
jgi:MFS transporter, SP family, sugar:H+ symporter